MPPHSTDTIDTTLGDLLRNTRIQQGCEIEDIAEATKISPNNLRSIESNDLAALPSDVFTRGFYTLYAKFLKINTTEILAMYEEERRNLPKEGNRPTPPPNRLAQNIKNLADPPNSLPFAYCGFMLLLLLLFGAFLCWYFSWNPASYLSFKLRSLDTAQQSAVVLQKDNKTSFSQAPIATTISEERTPTHASLLNLSSPAMATAATAQPIERSGLPTASSGTTKYHVNAIFQEETKVALIIDDNPQRTMIFKEGEQVSWRATEKLVITLPIKSKTKISLNQIPLQLPKPENDCITLMIPEYLLR
jgi:cytoskeleton protein RodZ